MDMCLCLWVLRCWVRRNRGWERCQVQVVHDHDLPLPGIFLHYETQQTATIGPRISLSIRCTRHLPMDIDSRHIGTDQPGLDGRVSLVTILGNRRKHRPVELFYFRSSARAFAPPIGKVSVFCKHCGKRLRIMPVPRVHEAVDHCHDGLLVGFVFGLASQGQRQSGKRNWSDQSGEVSNSKPHGVRPFRGMQLHNICLRSLP